MREQGAQAPTPQWTRITGDTRAQARTIVVGLGNPLLGDDGVGWRVVDEVEKALNCEPSVVDLDGFCGPDGECGADCLPDVDVDRLAVGGLRLMERLTGYESAVIVDAAVAADARPGDVRRGRLEELAPGVAGHLDSAHDTSLVTALGLGRRLGADLPGRVYVVTVQASRVYDFAECLTPEVEAAVPAAASAVMDLLVAVAV